MLNATPQYPLSSDGPPVAKDIQQNVYVDYVISGSSTKENVTYHKTRQIMPNLIYAVGSQSY